MAPAADRDLESSPVNTNFPDIPPFPKTVATAPLLRISLQKLAAGDEAEQAKLWEACCDLGFFYLDMRMDGHGPVNVDQQPENALDGDAVLKEADKLFDFMKELYALPYEEKSKYDLKDKGIYFGYVSKYRKATTVR